MLYLVCLINTKNQRVRRWGFMGVGSWLVETCAILATMWAIPELSELPCVLLQLGGCSYLLSVQHIFFSVHQGTRFQPPWRHSPVVSPTTWMPSRGQTWTWARWKVKAWRWRVKSWCPVCRRPWALTSSMTWSLCWQLPRLTRRASSHGYRRRAGRSLLLSLHSELLPALICEGFIDAFTRHFSEPFWTSVSVSACKANLFWGSIVLFFSLVCYLFILSVSSRLAHEQTITQGSPNLSQVCQWI